MSPVRLICLSLVFFLDVHVRAEAILSADGAHARIEKFNGGKVHLAPGALATWATAGEPLRLVRGRVFTEAFSEITTPFATFRCTGRACAAAFTRRTDGVEVTSVDGSWRVEPRGYAQELRLDAGTSVLIGEVGPDGRAAVEPPRTPPWTPFVRAWASTWGGDFGELAHRVRAFRPVWDEAVTRASEDNHARALAAVESNQRAAARRARAAAAVADEDARLRRLFREKNLIED